MGKKNETKIMKESKSVDFKNGNIDKLKFEKKHFTKISLPYW